MDIATNRFHFIGVGGIGMSGLAEILSSLGAHVSGSDMRSSAQTQNLEKLGVKIFLGHEASNVGDANVVVYSSAISKNNPEYVYALENKIPLIRRAEALAELMRLRRGIAVAGTHGKTTTTSLIAASMMATDVDPTIIVGGVLKQLNTNAKLGAGQWLIAEADESDGSFDKLSPEIAIITNIDNDHLDHFGSFANLKIAYRNFADKVPFYGRLIYCGDDSDLNELLSDFSKPVIRYGFFEEMDYWIKALGNDVYEVYKEQEKLGTFTCPVPGNHNALNSLAALITVIEGVGLSFDQAIKGLEQFSGVGRRFQIAPENKNNVIFIDDYAHHPTAVAQVLKAAKERYSGRRIVSIFQPHRYSRVQSCWDQFLNCFDLSDAVFFTDIYPAGEQPIEGVDSASLSSDLYHPNSNHIPGDLNQLKDSLQDKIQNGDVVLIMGAGNINQLTTMLNG